MKKIIAVFFAVALLIACFAVSASAATDIERGEEIQIKLSVDEYTGIKSGSVEFFFDEDVFEIVHGEWLISGAMLTDFNTDSARGVFAFASAKTVRTDVFSLTLRVKDDARFLDAAVSAEVKLVNSAKETITIDFAFDYYVLCSHSFGEEIRYDENGHWYACAGCGSKILELEHTFDSNCDSLCDDCGYEREVVHVAGEPVVENVVPPTCTEVGSYDSVEYCVLCNTEVSRETVSADKIDHEYSDYWYSNESVHWQICVACGISSESFEHTYSGDCDSYCDICDNAREVIHTPGISVIENEVEPGCTALGYYDSVTYCVYCYTEISREIVWVDAIGHSYSDDWTVDVEPTCTDNGFKSRHCERCDDRIDLIEIESFNTEHSFTDYKSDNNATYTEDGTKTAKCDNCSATDTVVDVGSALGLTQKFLEEVAALSTDADMEVTYAELYSALKTYAALSETEKSAVEAEYETLMAFVEEYNLRAQMANNELADATEFAFAPIVATGFAFMAALWFVLRKKFLI